MISDKGKFYWWVLLHAQTNLTKQPSIFSDWSLLHIYCAFLLFSSLRSHAPWKGIEQSDVPYCTLSVCIVMIFLHLLMTLVANVNSGFASWHSVQSHRRHGSKWGRPKFRTNPISFCSNGMSFVLYIYSSQYSRYRAQLMLIKDSTA